MNWRYLLSGGIVLAIGVCFYMTARPAANAYFLDMLPWYDRHWCALPSAFTSGRLGGALPSFLHALGFIWICAGVTRINSRRDVLRICMLWLVIAWSFEIGQNYPDLIIIHIPDWFENFVILENFGPYFKQGRFDVCDLAASAMGCAVAGLVLLMSIRKRREA